MKPAAFSYKFARSAAEALALIAEDSDDKRFLAGGQSLVPAMNFRLARPETLIDLNPAVDLDYIHIVDSELVVGTLTRHAYFERRDIPGPVGQILPSIAARIAHLPIRVRGTFGGSLAYADPSAEWCTLAVGLNARIVVESAARGRRTISASEFFKTIFTTSLRSDELIIDVRLPLLNEQWRCGFCEFSRRAGDYALAMAFVALRFERDRTVDARIALGGVSSTPVLAKAARLLIDVVPEEAVIEAVATEVCDEIEIVGDIHGSVDYRRHLAGVMTTRALRQALSRWSS